MIFFRSRPERELDGIIKELNINLQNNYKSTAHAEREKLGRRCEELYAAGKIKREKYLKYRAIYEKYTEMMKDYHH